ncbi:MAG: hypothetical protein CFE21_03905 [Bacteroidetes bacterium B1(2017)]|nr:MAG: hypothetical protein CFE21_03905 [Bacteroidetes bacterium B1(2017)]
MKLPSISGKQFWIGAVILHLLGFLQAWHTGSIYLVDSIDYLSQATNIKLHASLYAAPWDAPIKPDYYSFRPPVYGFLIYVVKLLVQTDYAILLLQMGISLSTLFGVLLVLNKLNLNAGVSRFLLLLLLVLYPSQIIHCNFVMSDILFQSLLFWAFYFTWQLWQEPNYKNSVYAVVFFAIAMLTKPVAFLLGISIALILVGVFLRKKALRFLLPFLLLPLIYHGYSSYNQRITGYYHYSSVTPIFVLKYMAKYTNGQLFGEAYADSVQDVLMAKINAQEVYKNRYELMNASGKEIIAQHPYFFAWFNIKAWFAFMLDPGRFEWVHFLNMSEGNYLGLYHVIHTQGLIHGLGSFVANAPLALLVILLVCLLFNTLAAFAFLRALFQKELSGAFRICLFLFVAYIIASTGVLGLSRYRVAVAPLLWLSLVWFILSHPWFRKYAPTK